MLLLLLFCGSIRFLLVFCLRLALCVFAAASELLRLAGVLVLFDAALVVVVHVQRVVVVVEFAATDIITVQATIVAHNRLLKRNELVIIVVAATAAATTTSVSTTFTVIWIVILLVAITCAVVVVVVVSVLVVIVIAIATVVVIGRHGLVELILLEKLGLVHARAYLLDALVENDATDGLLFASLVLGFAVEHELVFEVGGQVGHVERLAFGVLLQLVFLPIAVTGARHGRCRADDWKVGCLL